MLGGAVGDGLRVTRVCCLQVLSSSPWGAFEKAVAACVELEAVVFIFFCFVSSLLLFPQASVKFLLSEAVLMALGPSLLLLRPGVSLCCSCC